MKAKLLFFSTRPPFPPVDGTREHILSELKALAPFFQIDLFIMTDEKLAPEAKTELEKICGGRVIFNRSSRLACRWHALAQLFSAQPLQVSYFYSRRVFRRFQAIALDYDAFYCHTLRPAKYFLQLKDFGAKIRTRTLVDLNDAISLNYHYAAQRAQGLWRLIYAWEKNRVKNYELKLLSQFEHFSIVTDRDRDWIYQNWQKKYPTQPAREITVLRYGEDDRFLDYQYNPQNENLVFIGNLYYPPNRQGLKIFCQKIWPLILKTKPQSELLIIGRGAKELFSGYPQVRPLGFLDDPYELMSKQALFLNPITFGAGISTKTVLALALGIPIISTAIGIAGVEGLGANSEPVFLIDYDNPAAAAAKINQALADKTKLLSISQTEKALARSLYLRSKNNEALISLLRRTDQNN